MLAIKIPVSSRAARVHRLVERCAHLAVRSADGVLGALHLGGRKAAYDDEHYEFLGGAQDGLRAKHYDKALRLLWKAEEHAPWSGLRDLTQVERAMLDQAVRDLSPEEEGERLRITTPEYRAFLERTYSRREKEALVSILSAIGHGEAYAWLVSAELLIQLRSTGAKAAVTTQVLEEAKHFIVMRELIRAFEVPVPRLSAWEYFLLEQVLKAKGVQQLFGMNVLVEGIALGFLGLLSHLPGLEILRLFHMDESRHTALPVNYLGQFALSAWQKANPLARLQRTIMVLPAIPLIFFMEEDAAELGIDIFELGGAIVRRITELAERSGFQLVVPNSVALALLNLLMNAYCYATRSGHTYRDFRETRWADADFQPESERDGIGAGAG